MKWKDLCEFDKEQIRQLLALKKIIKKEGKR